MPSVTKQHEGAWQLPRYAHFVRRGHAEGVAAGSHRKSGVINGVKNLCPVESCLSFRAIALTSHSYAPRHRGSSQKLPEPFPRRSGFRVCGQLPLHARTVG